MINLRLDSNSIHDLLELSQLEGFPYRINENTAIEYCNGSDDLTVQTYGAYSPEGKLVAVMTATYFRVFPHEDSPNGRVVHISGAYTHPKYRNQGYASTLLKCIEKDAKLFKADYICCDSAADMLYIKKGFKYSNESRLWKKL